MLAGLLVFDDSPAGADVARRRFGGLTTLERGVRTLARAGVRRLLVVVPEEVLPRSGTPRFGRATRKLDLELEIVPWNTTPRTVFDPAAPVLILLGDHVHHHTSLSALAAAGLQGADVVVQTSAAPPQGLPFHRLDDPDADRLAGPRANPDGRVLTGALLGAGSLALQRIPADHASPLAYLAAAGGRVAEAAGDDTLWRRVADRASARQAKDMLFAQVTKKTSGPVSRHLNARLSIPISKMLIETGISPHLVTVLFVLTTGLTAAWLMARPAPYWRLALAGTFWQLAAVLDRCDGEIARVKLCESRFGAWFDTVTDNIAYLAAYVAFLFGIHYLYPDQTWALYLGFSAVGAMILALAVMYNYALKTGSGSLQNYLVGFRAFVPEDEKNFVYRALERYAFTAKRDTFAFVHFLFCLLGSFELLYAYTVGGLHLIVVGVLISQGKMLDGHRRRLSAQGVEAAEAVPEAVARVEVSGR